MPATADAQALDRDPVTGDAPFKGGPHAERQAPVGEASPRLLRGKVAGDHARRAVVAPETVTQA